MTDHGVYEENRMTCNFDNRALPMTPLSQRGNTHEAQFRTFVALPGGIKTRSL